MIEFEKPKIHTIEENNDYGKFVVEPLERGYGTTLGNSLRRILLSSLPGAAITDIQIDGVLHEFSTVEGVMEDVTTIILNLKKVALKMDTEKPQSLEIDVTGAKEVKAGFECGITLENYQDIKEQDIIEAYELVEIKR